MAKLALINDYYPQKDIIDNGVSQAYDDFVKLTTSLLHASSISLIDERSKNLEDELIDMYKECSEDNWDSYGSLPLKKSAFDEAKKFISSMPSWMPIPEVVPEPIGDIGFQWSFGYDKIITASLSGDNIVVYASILGSAEKKRNGSNLFNATIPNEIIDLVGEIRD